MNEPTGTIEILLNVLRAKELKEKNSSKKVIGFCEENNSDFEYFNQEENLNNLSYKKTLSLANLLNANRKVKIPVTKNRS